MIESSDSNEEAVENLENLQLQFLKNQNSTAKYHVTRFLDSKMSKILIKTIKMNR